MENRSPVRISRIATKCSLMTTNRIVCNRCSATLGRVCHGGTTVAPQSKERLEPPLLSLYRKAR